MDADGAKANTSQLDCFCVDRVDHSVVKRSWSSGYGDLARFHTAGQTSLPRCWKDCTIKHAEIQAWKEFAPIPPAERFALDQLLVNAAPSEGLNLSATNEFGGFLGAEVVNFDVHVQQSCRPTF